MTAPAWTRVMCAVAAAAVALAALDLGARAMATPTTARDGRLARWMIARTTTTVRAAAGRVAYGARGEDRRRAATRGTTPRRAAAAAAPTTGASLGACAHGYRSASDPELGCVCGHGYTGERCEIDSIPSCDRSETLTCAYVFSNWGDVFNYQSCACVSECEKVLKREHNLTDDEWWRVSRERPENARVCVDSRGRKVDMFTREVVADPREIKDKDMGMHHHNVCTHNCFGRGACKDRVCYCEPGRFGLLCQFDAEDVLPDTIQASVGTKLDGKREMRIEYYDGLSSHARIPLFTKAFYLDIKKEHLGEDDLHEQSHIEASMYATAVHLAETIVEDRWKRTLLTPRSGTHRFIPFFPTNIGANVGSVELYLPNVVRQLPNNDGDDDPWYIFVSMQDRGFCSIDRLRGMLPPRSIVVHSFGWQRFPGAQDTKATARCHQPDFDVVIPARRHPNQAPFDEKDFDPSSKNGPMLFFNGGVRKKADQCSGERLLQNRLSCMDEYSQGVRMYVVDTFQNVSGFSINEPHGGDSWSRETMKTAKYCLVAGGHGFDMRLVDGIARGCVPLLTAIQMSYPYDNVLDYSKFALNIGDRWGETSDKLQDLPNTLEKAYAKGDHGDMVRRLRYVHEVYIMEDELTDEEYREAHPNNVTDAGLATALASIAMVTNVVLPPYFRTTLCHVAYDFLDGRGHEIFKKDALDSFHCSQAERRAV